MTVLELLAQVKNLGAEMSVQGSNLVIDAPLGVITQELREAMVENKAEILAQLLLDQMRKGQSWLLSQHSRWQSGDTTAVDDAAFSQAWNDWWELDWRLRAEHGLTGCIHGPTEKCPEGFSCEGCMDVSAPGVVAQLELTAAISNG